MKKKTKILLLLLCLLLFIPVPCGTVKDGGTKQLTALTYRVVKWNRLIDAGDVYSETDVYVFPFNLLSLERLWNRKEISIPPEQNDNGCSYDHSPAETEQTAEDAYTGGWCGNVQSTIFLNGREYTFMYGDSVTLNALYTNHSFRHRPCKCEEGIRIKTEHGEFTVNTEKHFVRSDKGQGQLTKEQTQSIIEIIERQTAQ